MTNFSQIDQRGGLRHLVSIDGLPPDLVRELLDRSQHFQRKASESPGRGRDLAGVTIANIFSEPSTRTRVSFELAGKRLGADVINLDMMLSSRAKGETMLDTVHTLEAMQVDVFVIRDAQIGVPQFVAENVGPRVSILSAGEAHVSHPTQGLLDALTIQQYKGGFRDLVVAIVGDIRHSRVARSVAQTLAILGVGELRIVAPRALMPDEDDFAGAHRLESLEDGINHADVVMMLRVQRERMNDAQLPDDDAYFREWGLTRDHLRRARPDAIVMHPGPMNRGIEIASEVADGPQSVIRHQVANGVAVRMAVLSRIAADRRLRGA